LDFKLLELTLVSLLGVYFRTSSELDFGGHAGRALRFCWLTVFAVVPSSSAMRAGAKPSFERSWTIVP
jgi:hypothetical protein